MFPLVFPPELFSDYEGLTEEKRAEEFLDFLGWEPEKAEPRLLGRGVPDFRCSGNRWVEVKTWKNEYTCLSLGQLEHWCSLIQQGRRVFVLQLTTTAIFNFYEVTSLTLQNIPVVFK